MTSSAKPTANVPATEEPHNEPASQLEFLARVSAILSRSLNYSVTLRRVARLTVPWLADWCAVDLQRPDGSVERVAVTHVDPEKVEWAYEMRRRYPPDPNAPTGLHQVLRSGESALYREIDDDLLVRAARDEEHLALLRQVGFRSAMIVPLKSRNRILGALTLVTSESARVFDDEDLVLAEELAARAAVAIENAELYQEASRLNEELEQRVAQRTAELQQANEQLDITTHYLRELSQKIVTAQEDERRRLSRELHDSAAQLLTAIKISLRLLEEEVPEGHETLREHIRDTADLASDAYDEIRSISHALRPPALDVVGLNGALEALCRDFGKQTGIAIEYTGETVPQLTENVLISFYRMLQEVLANVVRHARTNNVSVTLTADEEAVSLVVEDDGIGFDVSARKTAVHNAEGVGLFGLRERFDLIGGDLLIESKPGEGTKITGRYRMPGS